MPRIKHSGLFKRCDHAVRGWATCPDPWWFRFHHGGQEYRFSLNKEERKPTGYVMNKDEARKLQDKYKLQIQEGSFRQPPAAKPGDVRLTVGDLMDRYVDAHIRVPERSKASQVVMECLLNRLREMNLPATNGTTVTLSQKSLDDVTAADLHVLRRDWSLNIKAAREGVTGPTRALKRLRHFYNWCIEQGHTTVSPFKRGHVNTVHFAKETGRTRRLEGDEEERLLTHAVSPLMKALITAALETGCRVGELLALTWADVKWDDNMLLLPAAITKTREARGVPISQNLKAVLDLRRHAPDGSEHDADARVFGNECGEPVTYWRVREDWRATCERAGVQGVNFHDLRRTSASMLRMSGAPDHLVAAWPGHSNISTTSRYLRASSDDLQKQLKAFEAHRAKRSKAASTKAKTDSHTVRTRARATTAPTQVADPSNSLH